jgi:AcrR family transcriptional regulator
MPKMSADYFEKKRIKILDAAFAVSIKKPMHEVSMRDIISESGLSQGGIYRYFSNLDEILIELINQRMKRYDVKALVNAAMISDDVPEKVIGEIFSIWKKAILENLIGVGKIYYEICIVYANDKDRLKNFTSKTLISSEESYLQEKSFSFIMQKITEGYFNPKLQLDDIFTFLITSLDGMIRDLILDKYYQIDDSPFSNRLDEDRLIKSLCTAFILLLGGNEKLI